MLKLGKNYLLPQLLTMGMQEEAAGGLSAEPGLCSVVGLCNPATVQRTDHGCHIPFYSVIVQEICSFWFEMWVGGLGASCLQE